MLVGFAKGGDECTKAVDVHTLGRARRDLRDVAAKKDGLPTMVIMSHGLYLLPEIGVGEGSTTNAYDLLHKNATNRGLRHQCKIFSHNFACKVRLMTTQSPQVGS